SVPAGFTRSVPAGFTRSVLAGFTRLVPAGFTRSVPAGFTRLVPAGFTRSVPAGFTRSVPAGFTRSNSFLASIRFYKFPPRWRNDPEARLSREAWVRSMDASDLARDEVMSLRTTILGQTIEIRELHAADRRRQIVTSEMLRVDHRRFAEIRGLRIADCTREQQLIQTLTGQVMALQGQQGPAGGPTQLELPEKAGSSS
nr:hypothetical protein [Tanacetum cinerariifolium]